MTAISSSAARQVPAGRRTVLLALRYEIGLLKNSIYAVARRAGWSVFDLHSCGMKLPPSFRPDGVLFQLGPMHAPLVRRLVRLEVPVVQIDDFGLPMNRCCVFRDHQAIGLAAAEHFVTRGFRNVAYLHSEGSNDPPFDVICRSFVDRARALGAQTHLIAVQHPDRLVPWTRLDTLAKRFRKAIAKLQLPLGIFTYHDTMAIRICHYCDAIGLSVPEQVAVLGYGNDHYKCDFASTPLSSVDPNYSCLGRTAAELLEGLMDGGPAPAEPIVVAPTGIVARKSTDVLALPDVDTARALLYMWEHISEPLGAPEIADAVAISRRKLERHFRIHLHRSITDELIRKRIERGCELLTGTDLSVYEIARQVGFRTETYFFRMFRKAMGMTPKKYRLAQTARLGEAGNAWPAPPVGPASLPPGQARR